MNPSQNVVEEIRRLFDQRGGSMYGGESVTQLEHALQAASLAEKAEAGSATISAALLHDIGHLLHDLDDDAPDKGVDDVHEVLANEWLTKYFPRDVTEPVRLHVAAKRYLCTVESEYYETLSEPSRVSFKLQGGALDEEEVREFEQHDLFEQIVHVRRYDDEAKIVDLQTPNLDHFLEHVAQCLSCTEQTEA